MKNLMLTQHVYLLQTAKEKMSKQSHVENC